MALALQLNVFLFTPFVVNGVDNGASIHLVLDDLITNPQRILRVIAELAVIRFVTVAVNKVELATLEVLKGCCVN